VSESVASVTVDAERCQGTGYCEQLLAGVFRVGPDGVSTVRRRPEGEAELVAAREAVELCPTRAIRVSYDAKRR
jgi:ferredoxin